jgi:hypothetical protein
VVLPRRERRLGLPTAGATFIPSPEALFVLVVVDGLVDPIGLTVGASVRLAVLLTTDELGKCGDQVAGAFKDQARIDGSGIAVVLEPYGKVPRLVDECATRSLVACRRGLSGRRDHRRTQIDDQAVA